VSSVIQVRGLSVRYSRSTVLRDVDFSIMSGEMVAIIGPNGAGKSSLLAALSGDSKPASGTVLFHGKPIGDCTARDLALRRAVLPQSTGLLFHFTAHEVVGLGLSCALENGSARAGAELIDRALDRVGIAHLRDRFVPTLSGGERQRVHLARCLAQLGASPARGAKLLMLDEPTASLDPAHQHRVMDIARNHAHAGNATIAVVHDLNLAAAYSDRLVILCDGTIAFDGPPQAGLTPHRLADVFGLDAEVMTHSRTGRLVVLQAGPR